VNTKTIVGIVMIAVALVVFPIILESSDTILSHTSLSTYTGLEAMVKVFPLVAFVGLLIGGGLSLWKGVKGK